MARVDSDRMRFVSAHLLGSRYRLELLTALAEASDGRVNLGDLAAQNGVTASVYYPSLRSLSAIQLVGEAQRSHGDRRRWYQRSGSDQLWELLSRLAADLFSHCASPGGSAESSALTV